MEAKSPLSVTQLNEFIKMLMESNPILGNVTVRGEISNFTVPRSGHLYLTLKDEEGQIKAVMFRTYASRLVFCPEDGMKVIAHGRVSIYGPSGQYQLYIDDLLPDGAGALAMRFEQLKRKLAAEGLFDEARKRPLPPMPLRIGVITSPTGAAVQDIRNVLGRRFPAAEMILFPASVQGTEAPLELTMGIEFFGMTRMCDVIIIGRGGGSAEDLWAFNDEGLARAIAACPIPVISAVGHEVDFTICDFVADRRAATPSAAAELAVPDRNELLSGLYTIQSRMRTAVKGYVDRERRELNRLAAAIPFRRPERMLEVHRMRLDGLEARLDRAASTALHTRRSRLEAASASLTALNPLSVLSRGFASVSRDGHRLTKADEVRIGDHVHVQFADGVIQATVTQQKGNDHHAE